MKKSLLYLVLLLSVISCTNFYTVRLQEDTPLYSSSEGETSVTIIPKDTEVFLSSKANKKNYKRIKWDNYLGWAYNPSYTTYSSYTPFSTSHSTKSTSYYTLSSNSGGSIQVKGYTRKDGTYVRPHTRSAPRQR